MSDRQTHSLYSMLHIICPAAVRPICHLAYVKFMTWLWHACHAGDDPGAPIPSDGPFTQFATVQRP